MYEKYDYYGNPVAQRVVKRSAPITRSAPKPAPRPYSPPAPVYHPSTTSSGSYNSGGGAPQNYTSRNNSGEINRTGNNAPPHQGGGPRNNNNNNNNNNSNNNNNKPKAPGIQKYLGGDEQYQQNRAELIKNFRNLKLTNKENRGNLELDKDSTLKRLGSEKKDALTKMQDDFAARGLFGGAEYQNKLGDFNLDFLNQETDTKESFQRNIEQLLKDLKNASSLKDQNLQQARLEALRRRAATYGLKA